jgi:hypothetical protein
MKLLSYMIEISYEYWWANCGKYYSKFVWETAPENEFIRQEARAHYSMLMMGGEPYYFDRSEWE